MFEVIIANSLSKKVNTRADADTLRDKAKALFGEVSWTINEVKTLYDEDRKPVSSITSRVASSEVASATR